MINEQEKIVNFNIDFIKGVTVTHGYNILNAFPVHFHSSYNLGIIELGEREFAYRGTRTILKKNDIFIIQPFEPHKCKSINNSCHSYKIISFNLNNYYYFPELIIHQADLLCKIRKFHTLVKSEKSSSKLSGIFIEIINQLHSYSTNNKSDILDKNITSKLNFAKHYIEKNCHLEISLKQMSDFACLSEFHFNRYFHKCYGLSPYAYYLVCKMKKAQKVLVKQKSIINTTYNMGLFDQSHFTKLFKKHIGVTPGKYLRDNK